MSSKEQSMEMFADPVLQTVMADLQHTLVEAAERAKLDIRTIAIVIIDSSHNGTATITGCGCPACASAFVTAAAGLLQTSIANHKV